MGNRLQYGTCRSKKWCQCLAGTVGGVAWLKSTRTCMLQEDMEANPATMIIPTSVRTSMPKAEVQMPSPLIGLAIAAGSALLLHLRHGKKKEKATNMAIAELKAERDLAQKQLQVRSFCRG